jgi:hypothetical protein
MARQLSRTGGRFAVGNLIASDFTGLNTEAVPIQRGQGLLLPGTFIARDGTKATAAANVHGVLHEYMDTELEQDTAAAVYTKGRFIRQTVVEANPEATIDTAFEDALRQKNITLELAG